MEVWRRVVIEIQEEVSEEDLGLFMSNLESEPWFEYSMWVEEVKARA